ncbi:MAG: Hcp family type VI secretion system effector [bacterium]
MAMTGYLKLTGMNQGPIQGDCKQLGHEDTILVYEFDHEISIPRDNLTGLPTGQRLHRPFAITKHIDNASPKLCQACTSGEQFSEVILEFYRINERGLEEHYYTIKLENAIVVDLQTFKPMTLVEETKSLHDMEKVSFTYRKIIWTYVLDGIESEDDWQVPKA